MIIRLLLSLLAVLSMNVGLQADVWNTMKSYLSWGSRSEAPSILVLLLHDVDGVDLEVTGKYSLYDPSNESFISSRFVGKKKYLQALSDGLKWGEAFPGLYQLKIRPDHVSTMIVLDGHEYIGPVYVYEPGRTETVSVVNQVPIDDYVRSILGNYDVRSLHPETISALAIVSRTNAQFQAENPKTTYWSVDAKKVGYTGIPPHYNPEVETAIGLTKSMIMSKTGVYEGVATPFAAEFGFLTPGYKYKEMSTSKITVEEANQMAQSGLHAAQILAKAFPGTTIMLSQ